MNTAMKRISPARLCCWLLLCSVPASMLAVIWTPPGVFAFLREHAPALYRFMLGVQPLRPTWPGHLAVQTLAAVAGVCALLWWLRRDRENIPARSVRAFLILLAAYGAMLYVSYLWSAWRYSTLRTAIRLTPILALSGLAAVTVRGDRRRMALAKAFAGAAVLQAALQGAVILLAVGGVESASGWSALRVAFRENQVFYANQNYSAAIVLTAAYLIVALLVRAWRSGQHDRTGLAARTVAGCAGLAVLGFILLVNWSLQARVAALVSVPVGLACLLPGKKAGRALIGLVVVGLIVTGVALGSARIRNALRRRAMAPGSTAHLRAVYWTGTAGAWARRPLFGWGAGTFPAVYPQLEPPVASGLRFTRDVRNTHPHNEFLAVAAHLGGAGLCIYLGLLGVAFITSYRRLRSRPPESRLVGFALWAGCLAFVVQSCFGRAPQDWTWAALFWVLLGTLCAAGGAEPTPEPDRPERARRGWIPALILGGLLFWAWCEWGIGGYRSMVSLRRAAERQLQLRTAQDPPAAYRRYRKAVEQARPRCLWPPLVLNHDYVIGWFLTDHGEWEKAERHLTRHVPAGMLKTRVLLARCAAATGRPQEARERLLEYVERNPYDLEGYQQLAGLDRARAAELLAQHLRNVEGDLVPQKVQELLYLYLQLERREAARNLVQRARQEGLGPEQTVVPLAQRLASSEAERDRLKMLQEVFPELRPPDDSGASGVD